MGDTKDTVELIVEEKHLPSNRVTTALIDAGYLRPEPIQVVGENINVTPSHDETIGRTDDSIDVDRTSEKVRDKLHVSVARKMQPNGQIDFDLYRAAIHQTSTSKRESTRFRVIYEPNNTDPRDCCSVDIETSKKHDSLDKRLTRQTVLTFGKSGSLREIYVNHEGKSGRITRNRNREEKWEVGYPKDLDVETVEKMAKDVVSGLDINNSKIDLRGTFANAFSTLQEEPSIKNPADLLALST